MENKLWNIFKVNNKDTISGIFIVNFEHISLLLTLRK